MRRGSKLHESGEARNSRPLQEGGGRVDEWFTVSTQQLRDRTTQEGAFVNRPSREVVERLIDWFHADNSQIRQ